MWQIEVTRSNYSARNRTKETESLFYVQHRQSRIAEKMFKLLASNHVFEGGDIVVYKQNGKVKKRFSLCNICCKEPAKTKSIRCSKCNKSLINTFTIKLPEVKTKTKVHENFCFYKY
jgi:hypothetical protein